MEPIFPNQTAIQKTRRRLRTASDLVTNEEELIGDSRQQSASHEVSGRRKKPNNSQSQLSSSRANLSGYHHRIRTQSAESLNFAAGTQDEDLAHDDLAEFSLTPEEERVVSKLLTFARKGKINQANAFDMPLKLSNPDASLSLTSDNSRFWKYASEMLGVSMLVYDKRVDNAYLTAQKVIDKLVRAGLEGDSDSSSKSNGEGGQSDPNAQNEKRKNLLQLLLAAQKELASKGPGLSELFDPSSSAIPVGRNSLEQPAKLTIPKNAESANVDPLFAHRLKIFDDDSLSSLLMNIYGLNDHCEIRLCDSLFEKPNKPIAVKQDNLVIEEQLEEQQSEEDCGGERSQRKKSLGPYEIAAQLYGMNDALMSNDWSLGRIPRRENWLEDIDSLCETGRTSGYYTRHTESHETTPSNDQDAFGFPSNNKQSRPYFIQIEQLLLSRKKSNKVSNHPLKAQRNQQNHQFEQLNKTKQSLLVLDDGIASNSNDFDELNSFENNHYSDNTSQLTSNKILDNFAAVSQYQETESVSQVTISASSNTVNPFLRFQEITIDEDDEQADISNYSLVSPWQFHFKNQKLQRKPEISHKKQKQKQPKSQKGQKSVNAQPIPEEEDDIDFTDPSVLLNRDDILPKHKRTKMPNSKQVSHLKEKLASNLIKRDTFTLHEQCQKEIIALARKPHSKQSAEKKKYSNSSLYGSTFGMFMSAPSRRQAKHVAGNRNNNLNAIAQNNEGLQRGRLFPAPMRPSLSANLAFEVQDIEQHVEADDAFNNYRQNEVEGQRLSGLNGRTSFRHSESRPQDLRFQSKENTHSQPALANIRDLKGHVRTRLMSNPLRPISIRDKQINLLTSSIGKVSQTKPSGEHQRKLFSEGLSLQSRLVLFLHVANESRGLIDVRETKNGSNIELFVVGQVRQTEQSTMSSEGETNGQVRNAQNYPSTNQRSSLRLTNSLNKPKHQANLVPQKTPKPLKQSKRQPSKESASLSENSSQFEYKTVSPGEGRDTRRSTDSSTAKNRTSQSESEEDPIKKQSGRLSAAAKNQDLKLKRQNQQSQQKPNKRKTKGSRDSDDFAEDNIFSDEETQ